MAVSLVHPALPAGSPAASRSGSLASRSGRLAPPAAGAGAAAEGELGRVSSAAYVTKAMSSFVRSASEKVSVWFAAAGREIKCLSVMPANLDLLALYGLYAQATKGDQTLSPVAICAGRICCSQSIECQLPCVTSQLGVPYSKVTVALWYGPPVWICLLGIA